MKSIFPLAKTTAENIEIRYSTHRPEQISTDLPGAKSGINGISAVKINDGTDMGYTFLVPTHPSISKAATDASIAIADGYIKVSEK